MWREGVTAVWIYSAALLVGGCGDADNGTEGTDTAASDGTDSNPLRFSISAQLASEVHPDAPGTVGIVTWSVNREVSSAHIAFGPDTAYGMTAPVDMDATAYRTLLLGMKPDRHYHYRIVATTEAGVVSSADNTLDTGPATNLVNLDIFRIAAPERHTPGFIITSLYEANYDADGESLGSVAFIIDPDGEIVWWYRTADSSVCRARISADGRFIWFGSLDLMGGLERVSLDTLETEIFEVGFTQDIAAVSGETMAYLDFTEPDCASIFEIDGDGNTREVFESEGLVPSRDCRGNALRYSATEDVYTFSDHTSDLLVVERSGAVAWRLSDIVPAGWGGDQHGHQLLDGGMLVYANSGGTSGNSAAVEFGLNGETLMRYDLGFFTYNLGDVQRLPGGTTLVTASTAGTIREISPEGSVLMEIEIGAAIGYVEWRRDLYGPPDDTTL